MHSVWQFIIDHQAILGRLGGGIATVISAGWAVYVHFFPAKERKAKADASPSVKVTQSGTGIASGGNTTISAPVNIGLDEKKTSEQIIAALKPLAEQQEKLAAQIARDKGVPVAPLRAILIKIGEAGVSEEMILQRLDAKADELIKLRKEIAQLKQGPADLASFAQRAQALIDQGDLDGAGAVLAEGRANAHGLRERSSRYEADFLAREAEIDHLQLAYRSAAAKYLEAAELVADFDGEKQ